MKFKFPSGATVRDSTHGAKSGASVKVRDAILEAAGGEVNCEESKLGHRLVIDVHLKGDSDDECRFVLALPTGIHPNYKI
jgi:hypothetical protein